MSETTPPIPTLEDSVAYRIHRAARLLRRNFLEMGVRTGVELTPEQWFVLNKLRHQDGQSQVELCDDLLADPPNLSRIVRRMEKAGMVSRRRKPGYGPSVHVWLTEQGRNYHDTFARAAFQERRTLLGDLDPDDVEATLRVLSAIEDQVVETAKL